MEEFIRFEILSDVNKKVAKKEGSPPRIILGGKSIRK